MSESFILAEIEELNMVSSWKDVLYCTIEDDGTISLSSKKEGDELSSWLDDIVGIKTPEDFIKAYHSINQIETDAWSLDDEILPVLFEHFPIFAVATFKYLEIKYGKDESEIDFFNLAFSLLIVLDLDIDKDFKIASKKFSDIYDFTKQYYQINHCFPFGVHKIDDYSILFPKKYFKYEMVKNKEKLG